MVKFKLGLADPKGKNHDRCCEMKAGACDPKHERSGPAHFKQRYAEQQKADGKGWEKVQTHRMIEFFRNGGKTIEKLDGIKNGDYSKYKSDGDENRCAESVVQRQQYFDALKHNSKAHETHDNGKKRYREIDQACVSAH